MKKFKSDFDQIVYWAVFVFSAIALAYLLVVVINTVTQEDVLYLGTSGNRKHSQSVVLETSRGDIHVTLLRTSAPIAVANFAQLINDEFYDNTKFHRVIKGVLIQGGDPLSRESNRELYGTGGSPYVFEDEISGKQIHRGDVVMANRGKPNTNGSQFMIIVADDVPDMNGKYTIFGRVTEGMSVVDLISNAPVDENDIPVNPVYLQTIYFD